MKSYDMGPVDFDDNPVFTEKREKRRHEFQMLIVICVTAIVALLITVSSHRESERLKIEREKARPKKLWEKAK